MLENSNGASAVGRDATNSKYSQRNRRGWDEPQSHELGFYPIVRLCFVLEVTDIARSQGNFQATG